MARFETTSKYKLIYIFEIHDEQHKGLLKIGEATVSSTNPASLVPNCNALNVAAKNRIKGYTTTAGISFELKHTELALREVKFGEGIALTNFSDKDVHNVLFASGKKRVQPNATSGNEWFEVDLETAKNAIKAVKEGRKSLTSNEISNNVPTIVFRDEQKDAIEKTLQRFKKHNEMLWYAKMRFGKTLTSLEVVRRAHYRRVIIVTHRPVVGSGWQEDFYKIFRKGDDEYDYSFEFKKSGGIDIYDAHIDAENDANINNLDKNDCYFIYFASIQDLRGSKRVGGTFNKNNAVFDLEWDLIIVDEAHEGTQTELGDSVIKELRKEKTKVLALSGTPFNILDQYEDDGVYTWDYVMEQQRKAEWDTLHPGDHNPYADLPQMHIFTYNLGENIPGYAEHELEGKAFNFREFFRTFTGDIKQDKKSLPVGKKIGDFIHEADVNSFLALITKSDGESLYPYSTEEYRNMFKHTLWMVPGVKEAKALSNLLREHPVFSNFGIANVAGEGDDYEDTHSEDALELVRNTIKNNEYSITLSCGKLTTGVTVKEWTAVFMLSGSYSTAAAGYMQTIFRVQSAGQVDGKQKTDCYVFDFAPDRTLKVLAETANISRKAGKAGKRQEGHREAMGSFLNFCPVIAISGTEMKPYSVNTMMEQLKRVYAEKAIKNGFDDASIYNDNLMRLDDLDLENFSKLKGIIGSSKASPPLNDVEINAQGFNEEEHEKAEKVQKKPKKERTPEEEELLKKLQEQRKNRNNAISILRGVSIRMPLLIYGADVPFEEDISIERFVELVDDESWKEFMPNGVTKTIFADFLKYYDRDVFISAGREIRKLAANADTLTPTERAIAISRIFRYFKNPDKETVLTPWRVVNMHMSDTLGGWCFYDEDFETLLEEPRFIDQGEATTQTVNNPDAQILEINSKSGLYPLYVTYSIYRAKLGEKSEGETDITELNRLWYEAVSENVFVICKTPMAKSITRRTLLGYQNSNFNAHYFDDLINMLRNKPEQFKKRILKGSYWKKEVKEMKFDAIVGNPPYQENIGAEGNDSLSRQLFPDFIKTSMSINTRFVSLITPARWFTADAQDKSFVKLREFIMKNNHIKKMAHYKDEKDIFRDVEIKGGVCYFLYDDKHTGDVEFAVISNDTKDVQVRSLFEENLDVIISDIMGLHILRKVQNSEFSSITKITTGRNPFGIIGKDSVISKISKGQPFDGSCELRCKGDVIRYIKNEEVTKNREIFEKYKVFISKSAGNPNSDFKVIGIPYIGLPNSACTDSLFTVGCFESITEAQALHKYMQTKFLRYMISIVKASQNVTQIVYQFVPMQNFTDSSDINWKVSVTDIDKQLYNKYGLNNEEINHIEHSIKPIDINNAND